MRVLGQDEVENFIRASSCPVRIGELRALVCEISDLEWKGTSCITSSYPSSSTGDLPIVRFYIDKKSVVVQCVVRFETGVVLIQKCSELPTQGKKPSNPSDREAA